MSGLGWTPPRLASAIAGVRYDGFTPDEIAARLALPRVVVYDVVGSTLDVAHELGEQASDAGTLVLADAQSAGRGRMGRRWQSRPGQGVWLSLLERPGSEEALGVLSLRVALALAPVLESFTAARVQLKWPNDVFVDGRKLAGVLLEARWRGSRLDWLAVGVGINVIAPPGFDAASLAVGTDRLAVLEAVVPALRGAVATPGSLSPNEVAAFAARDFAFGRRCSSPADGRVAGIDADGALLVDTAHGRAAFHAGSLLLTASGASSVGDTP